MVIRVVVVEDHALVSAALRSSLDSQPDLDVVGIAETFAAGIDLVARVQPDVALLDLRIGDETAVEHLDGLLAASPGTSALVLTGWATDQSLVAAIEAGASGYLTKGQSLDHLLDAIRRVHRGETVVAPELVTGLLRRAGADQPAELSAREVQILELLARGDSTADVADALFLSTHTIRNNIGSILRKLGVHSRLEAVGEGIRRGVISPAAPPSTPR